jgi:hypothetical protein
MINHPTIPAYDTKLSDVVNHPSHYGGDIANNPYETIKVIEAWGLGFHLGNAVKYISRAGKKDDLIQDLEKARWYLDREIANLKSNKASSCQTSSNS